MVIKELNLMKILNLIGSEFDTMFKLVNLVVLSCVIATAYAVDYCEVASRLCNGKAHIACNNTGAFYPVCEEPYQVPMTLELKGTIINVHNIYRNKTAAGLSNLNRKAAAMNTLLWSNELASLAELNSKQCNMKHDRCRNTDKFQTSGQNLAWQSTSDPISPAEIRFAVINGISKWFNENKYAEGKDIDSFNRLIGLSGKQIGHFTLLAKDIITRVGCAVVKYMSDGDTNVYLVCNYGNTNMQDEAVFVSGEPASKCTNGVNKRYKNLCASI
ncbi:unnamed protein product [Diamesa serratosioi]